ncbi:MAG: hypothetical protein EBR86_01095 [Planctomycetia bacterium]|nr:hypothetical protein [Planctomycetia bacterium]
MAPVFCPLAGSKVTVPNWIGFPCQVMTPFTGCRAKGSGFAQPTTSTAAMAVGTTQRPIASAR